MTQKSPGKEPLELISIQQPQRIRVLKSMQLQSRSVIKVFFPSFGETLLHASLHLNLDRAAIKFPEIAKEW